jgi:hypothetical protein
VFFSSPAKTSVAICAIAKNESPYLAEWAVYHRMIGFDRILVYNNESTDDSEAVLAQLSAAGVLEYCNWSVPANAHIQRLAYRDGLKRLRRSVEWIAFIDIDEFVVIPNLDDIHVFLQRFQTESAIAINWKMFGTSHKQVAEPGLVMERFLSCARRSHRVNRAVKTLAKCSALVDPNLHNHEFAEGVVYRTVTGEAVPPKRGRILGEPSHDVIRINHYFTKSREEWDRKVARGRATKPAGHPDKFRTEQHFRMCDRNEQVDEYMLRFVPGVRRRLAELQLLPLAAC